MNKTRTACIWRESIYKDDFKCKCGKKLADVKPLRVNKSVLLDEFGFMYCPECHYVIGRVVQIPDNNLKDSELCGDFDKWKKEHLMS